MKPPNISKYFFIQAKKKRKSVKEFKIGMICHYKTSNLIIFEKVITLFYRTMKLQSKCLGLTKLCAL